MRRTFYKVTQLTSVIALPTFLGMSVLAPEVMLALYGPEWAPSVPVMQILMFIGILHSAFYLYGNVLKAAGKPSWRFGILLLIAISNVVGFALAVRWGIVAVAATYVIVGYLVSPLYFSVVRRVVRVNLGAYLQQYVSPLTGSLAMLATVLGLKYTLGEELGLYLQLFIYVLAGGVVYVLVLHLTARSLSRQVLELVRLVLPGLRSRRA
jgi:PST family polysaccharide transporter